MERRTNSQVHARVARVVMGAGLLCVALAPSAARAEPASDARSPAALSRLTELGITLALTGRDASAESVFVTLLSRPASAAAAFNNLGNLHLWRGSPEVALEFYRAASAADTADAGIRLNGATALMIAGDQEGARLEAEAGVRRAGGIERAAALLGLQYEGERQEPAKAARVRMGREEALLLLRTAARAVPPDSLRGASPADDPSRRPGRRPVPAWRSAGARSGDFATRPIVYWKE